MHVKNWLVYSIGDRAIAAALRQHARGGLLLDIGCGEKPYVALTRGLVDRHVGVDHPGGPFGRTGMDAASTAYHLPFRDGTFRTVMSTSVLEHLEEPVAALLESHRVLEPGGVMICVTPFLWHLHQEPRDFFRYTSYGLQHVFTRAGFTSVEVVPLSGFWVTFGQLLVYQLYRAHRGPLRWIPVIPLLGLVVQVLARCVQALDPFAGSRKSTWAYLTVARKPAPAAP